MRDAVQLALKQNKSVQAAEFSVEAAGARIRQARAGLLPNVNYAESLTRSNNPVFVFSSLLTQHQFTPSNFDIYALNRPGFLDNFQSALSAEQTVFDAGQTRKAIGSAELTHKVAGENKRQTLSQLTFAVVKAYFDVALSEQALDAATQALKSAQADLDRSENVRKAGMSTDADVLSIRVHVARVRQQQIRREADVSTARAALNDALGLSLDTAVELTTPLRPVDSPRLPIAELETAAVAGRPEQRRANLMADIAGTQAQAARSALWPKIAVRGVFESDRQQFANRGGANWLGQVSLSWNVFNGGADRARIAEANQSRLQAEAERDRLAFSLRLEVRRAWDDLRAAEQQVDVSEQAVAEAEESLRITQNRFGAGMSTVTDLLRTEVAVLETRTQHVASLHDQRLAAALLELATGKLSIDSPAVNE